MSENGRVGDEQDPRSYTSWSASGYEGPPPWRRGFRPGYLVLSLARAAPGRMP
jgi:hypothetical protein